MWKHLALVVVVAAGSATLVRAAAPPRGYQPRGCGFDLNDNGVRGEAADCVICDALLSGGEVVGGTADPDGDGVDEDLIYVDCDGGTDRPNCGTPGNAPCASITYAFGQRADGPRDGAEDIVCFRGTCAEPSDLSPRFGGVPGARTERARGSEEWDFEFPTDPAMLVGWDTDGDGNYPPFDRDDTAVMHGDPDERPNENGAARAFSLNTGVDNSYFEMAHFVARDYGRDGSDRQSGGFMRLNGGQDGVSHLYLHDLSLIDINKDRPGKSGRSTFNWFAARDYSYVAIINIEALENGGYLNRGAGTDAAPDAGPARFQNITYTAHSCDFTNAGGGICPDRPSLDAFATVAKIWGYVSRFEWLDNRFDANVAEWIPKPVGGPAGASGIGAAQCAQDWVIRNNEFIDFKIALSVQGWDRSACTQPGRPVDGIVFDRNIVRNTSNVWQGSGTSIAILGNGPTELRTTGDLTFTNNFISSTTGWGAAIDVRAGNQRAPNPGRIVIANNTIDGQVTNSRSGAVIIRGGGVAFPHQDFQIRNNLLLGVGADRIQIGVDFEPSRWQADHNAFDPAGSFSWDGRRRSLTDWRQLSGGDRSSRACNANFVNRAGGDYHLSPSDRCALDRGSDVAAVDRDIDGDRRPQGAAHDIGADEASGSGSSAEIVLRSIGAHDGRIQERNESSDRGGASNSSAGGKKSLRVGDDRQNRQLKSIVSFDTSQIPPGARIVSATLRLRRGRVVGVSPFQELGTCFVDAATGGFGGDTTLRSADFEVAPTVRRVGRLSDAPRRGDWSEARLDRSGINAIDRNGVTQFRIYFGRDDNDDGRNNFIGYFSGDGNPARQPQLVVVLEE